MGPGVCGAALPKSPAIEPFSGSKCRFCYGRRCSIGSGICPVCDTPIPKAAQCPVPKGDSRCTEHFRFSYGKSFAVKKQTVAILKATTALITAPPNVVDYVVVQTGAEYDWKSDTYQLPCSRIGTLPDMVFQLGTFEYRLPGKERRYDRYDARIRQVRFTKKCVYD